MSEFFKSAFDYFGNSSKSKINNELVGNSIAIGKQTFKVISTIAEGGFSFVFEAQDVKTHKMYALKRLISHDNDTNLEIMAEINYLKKLSGHPNIIRLFTAASIGQQKPGQVGCDFLIVTELCKGGQVIQLMQRRNKAFPCDVTVQIFHQICQAIAHMHSQNPPLIHRDLKVENLLISDRAVIKLCDFGSATTDSHYPNNFWTGLKRSEVQEEIEKHTTPMYRAPEMLDLYQNFPITEACDIWALGCVLYYLCCNKHPFEDSAKLAILNANYTIPLNAETNDRISGLIYQMLLIDPVQRSSIVEITNEIRVQAASANIPLKPSIMFDKDSLIHLPHLKPLSDADEKHAPLPLRPQPQVLRPIPSTPAKSVGKAPERSSQVGPTALDTHTTITTQPPITTPMQNGNDGKKVLGLLKEGAGNIMKNIRDASNKVMDQVSSSMNKTGLDLTYITSRIIMMPSPAEAGLELLTKDKLEDVQTFLDCRHSDQYYVYNLDLKCMPSDKQTDRIIHLAFDPIKSLPLKNLVMLCMHQLQWLQLDPKNVIVVQCADGRVASGINIVSLLCFCRLVDTSSAAADIVRSRRGDCAFTPSQLRYADYVCRLMRNIGDPNTGPDIPHNHAVKITGIELQPVPFFNTEKSGLRPFVEIFKGYKLVYSSMANGEDLCLFTYDHKSAHISIPNVNAHGDINIVIYHTRSDIVTKGKISTTKVCETQIYSGYLSSTCSEICLTKNQLDNCDSEEDRYPAGFNLKIQLHVTHKDEISNHHNQTLPWNSDQFKNNILHRMPQDHRIMLFNNKDEMQEFIISSGVKLPMKEPKPKPPLVPTKPTNPEPKGDFLFTLDWTIEAANEMKEIIPECTPELADSSVVDLSNKNELNYERFCENEKVEVVQDLLGDFVLDGESVSNDTTPIHGTDTNIDDLVDFFSAFSVIGDEPKKSSSSADLLTAFGSPDLKDDSNLLFFGSSDNDISNTFMFDPFGQGTTNSNSIADLTSQPSRLSDWDINAVEDPISNNHQSQSFIKSSNSTSCLSNMNNNNKMKTSPSFDGTELPQWQTASDHLPEPFKAAPKPVPVSKPIPTSKPIPAPKPKLTNKASVKIENLSPINKNDAFQDLLGDFKPSDSWNSSASNDPIKPIKDVRKETQPNIPDRDTLKILGWTNGREKNIRVLLCSLPSILWSDVRWPGVKFSELVTVLQVKKAYKNAVRCVHPDKWNNCEHENLAKLIMMELNEAMTKFEAKNNV